MMNQAITFHWFTYAGRILFFIFVLFVKLGWHEMKNVFQITMLQRPNSVVTVNRLCTVDFRVYTNIFSLLFSFRPSCFFIDSILPYCCLQPCETHIVNKAKGECTEHIYLTHKYTQNDINIVYCFNLSKMRTNWCSCVLCQASNNSFQYVSMKEHNCLTDRLQVHAILVTQF